LALFFFARALRRLNQALGWSCHEVRFHDGEDPDPPLIAQINRAADFSRLEFHMPSLSQVSHRTRTLHVPERWLQRLLRMEQRKREHENDRVAKRSVIDGFLRAK
jgi:hypothetical protein